MLGQRVARSRGQAPESKQSAQSHERGPQTSMISASLCLQRGVDRRHVLVGQLLHPLLGAVHVVRPVSPFLSSSLRWCRASRRTLRTATLPSSARCRDLLDQLLAALLGQRRDRQPHDLAVVAGRQPEVGLLDRALDVLHRGLVVRRDRQQAGLGDADRRQLVERRLRAVVVTWRRSSSAVDARPVRTVVNSCRVASTDLSMLRLGIGKHVVDHRSPLRTGHAVAGETAESPRSSRCARRGRRARCSSRRRVEHVDRQVVVHAQRERRRVHHLESALDRLDVRISAGISWASGFSRGSASSTPSTPFLPIRIAWAPISQRAQRGRRIGREERVAGARREDHDAALLEVADRPPPDVRLGDLGHVDRRHAPACTRPAVRARPARSSAFSTVASMPA